MKKIILFFFTISIFHLSAQEPVLKVTFDVADNPLKAIIGNDLLLSGTHHVIPGCDSGDGAVQITKGSYYQADLSGVAGFNANNRLNQWSLVFDLRLSEQSNGKNGFSSLYQTNILNVDDAECFIRETGELGIDQTGYCAHRLKRNEWHRIAILMNCSSHQYAYYIDGVLVASGNSKNIIEDGRFAFERQFLLFADSDGKDSDIDVSGITLYNCYLSDSKVKSLGGFGHEIEGKHLLDVPFLYDPAATAIKISWHATDLIPRSVEYGITPEMGTVKKSLGRHLSSDYYWHTARLSELQPNTLYYYRIKSNTGISPVYTFKTLPEDEPKKLRFLILGDSHANIGRTSVLLDSAVNKLKSLYGTDLHDCLDMILHTGDITNDGSTISDYMNLFFRPFSSLSPYIPMLLVPGSNEMEHPYFYEYILNEDISAQPKGHPDYMRYWAKKVKNVLFIGLNSYSESFDAIAQSRVPGLDERQVAWLREILDQTASDGTIDMVFCLVHECPVSELGRQGAGAYVSQQLYPLLRQYPKVKQISYGHTHAYERGVSQPLDDHAQEDLVLLCNGNSGCDLDRWNTPGYIQKDQPEISVALDHWCFTVGEIDGDNKCFKFDTYSLGNTDYKLHSEKADHWYGNLNQSAPDMPQGLSFEEGPDNEWSFTCGPFVGEGSLYSTQFQLLKEKDQEQTVILNSLRDRQNIFGVDADFVPVDQHETIDILTLKTVLNNLDMDYSYSSRVRFRDDNRKWSEWSDPQKLSFATTLNKPASDSFSVFNEQGASRIHLVFTDDNNRTLIISDMAGKIIMQRMIEGEQFTWSYTGMPKGIYVITAGSGSQTVQAKVRIE